MSTAKKILGNTAIQVAGRAIMAVTSVVVLRLITGFFSLEEYGMYTSVYEFLAFFGIAADLGLFTIAVREMGKGERHERDFIASNILGMRMVLAATMMALATVAAFVVPSFEGTYISGGVAIASMAVFLAILHGTVSSVLQVELKMQYSTIGLVGGKLISLGWMLAVVYVFFAGEPSEAAFYQLMVAGVVGNLFAFLFTFVYALKYARLRPKFSREYWKKIVFTAVPYGAALILNMVYFRIDNLMLLFIEGPREVAYYGPAVRVLEILSVLPVYFMNSVLPKLSSALKQGSAKVTRMLRLSFDFLFMAGVPMVVGLCLLSYQVISLISDNPELLTDAATGVYGSDAALQILVFAMFFAFMNSLFTYSLLAVNKQNHLLWINGSAAAFNVVANLFVIPEYGFRGAAGTSVATEAYILCMAWLVARRHLRYQLDWGVIFKTLVAAGAMGALVWTFKDPWYTLGGLERLHVLYVSGAGALLYGGLLYGLKAVPEEFVWRR